MKRESKTRTYHAIYRRKKRWIHIITFKRLPCAKLVGDFSLGRREGGGKLSPPPFKETKKSKLAISSGDISQMYERKTLFFQFSMFHKSPKKGTRGEKNNGWLKWASSERQRKVQEERIYRVLQVTVAASKPLLRASRRVFHFRIDTVPSSSSLPWFKLATFLQKSHNYEPSRTRRAFTVGTLWGKTQQVGKGKKERDGSNWIHRFLRN